MNSSSLCSLAGRYDNPIPPRFLAPIDSLKIPALATQPGEIGPLESILGLLKFKNYFMDGSAGSGSASEMGLRNPDEEDKK
jgi:hypothetical protein